MSETMRAVVIRRPGPAEVLQVEELPIPTPDSDGVLIRVMAFGINRSELFTRQGHSPNVRFPRVLGIEAVGVVEAAPGGQFPPGQTVATAMGGMGRDFDGGYAQYTCVPAANVVGLSTELGWEVLGALPEMVQTAWGSLHTSLRIERSHVLLIRGGTTSVGLAAAVLAKQQGLTVAATTRQCGRDSLLRHNGADHVFVDEGSVADAVREQFPAGVDRVLELVGTTTLLDSLQCVGKQGIVCMTGMVGNAWEFKSFSPMGAIPTSVCLTSYAGGAEDFIDTPLQQFVTAVEREQTSVRLGPTFTLETIAEAHRCMEENRAGGKIVVLPWP
jgi:NADPH:quinone reductase-like Zn-dependent oxidoreductase